jgi:hypothetical protein
MSKKHSNDHKSGRRLPESLTSGVRKRPVVTKKAASETEVSAVPRQPPQVDPKARTPMPPGFMHQGRVDQVAIELNLFSHDWRKSWRSMERSGRITMLAAVGTMLSVFLPWVSTPHLPYGLGILTGGGIHFALSVFAIYLLTSRKKIIKRMLRRGKLNRSLRLWMRRIALWHIFLGAASCLASMFFLVYYGFLQRQPDFEIKIHFGFYLSLFFGGGLAFGGWSYFSRYSQEQ